MKAADAMRAMIEPGRYLTPAEKTALLADWAEKKAEPRPAGELGGMGWPDPEIFALVDAVNELPGICTTQSCAGHRLAPDYIYPGHLWLRLDEARAAWLFQHMPVLASLPTVEEVSWLARARCPEVVSILFKGQGDGQLAQSIADIAAFFGCLPAAARSKGTEG